MYWKITSLVVLALFFLWIYYESHRTVRLQHKRMDAFWERERRANATRKKPLDGLDYVQIPEDLPRNLHVDDDNIASYIRIIDGMMGEKIVNFTGYSNTDLKLMYGAPNITKLTVYDQNFTTLVTTLQKWADALISYGDKDEAIKIMEYCVSIRSDVGKTYYTLAEYYIENGRDEDYFNLIETAESLNSLNKDYIAQALKDKIF